MCGRNIDVESAWAHAKSYVCVFSISCGWVGCGLFNLYCSFHCSAVSDHVFECVCDYVPNPAVSLVAFVRCFGTGECVKVVSDRANVSMPTLALPRSVLGECVEDGEQKT